MRKSKLNWHEKARIRMKELKKQRREQNVMHLSKNYNENW